MARLDLTLLLAFGGVALLGLTVTILSFRKAMKVASHRDGDLKMFLWAALAMISLIVAGMSAAYIVLPILFHL